MPSIDNNNLETGKLNGNFRQWNPDKLRAIQNGYSIPKSCPMWCICCWCVETVFKSTFKGIIDEIHYGTKSVDEMFKGMGDNDKCLTHTFRCIGWLLNVLGHFCLFCQIMDLFKIPLI